MAFSDSLAYEDDLHSSVIQKVAEAKTIFPLAIAILSNSVGTNDDIGMHGAKKTELNMKLPVILHKNKKPSCINEVTDN